MNQGDQHRIHVKPLPTDKATTVGDFQAMGDAFSGNIGTRSPWLRMFPGLEHLFKSANPSDADPEWHTKVALQRLIVEGLQETADKKGTMGKLPPTIINVMPWNLPDGVEGLQRALQKVNIPAVVKQMT